MRQRVVETCGQPEPRLAVRIGNLKGDLGATPRVFSCDTATSGCRCEGVVDVVGDVVRPSRG